MVRSCGMATLSVTGGSTLSGEIPIAGRKNAALKLLAASLLTTEQVTLTRVPAILDVQKMVEIMRALGSHVTIHENTVSLTSNQDLKTVVPYDLGRALRASLVLVGPLLARFGTATFPHPGGCVIGKRGIGTHVTALEQLGAHIALDDETYTVSAPNGLTGTSIYLTERSVTATENLMMAACLAKGVTTIRNAAEEDHIRNLADLLRAMGYQVEGDGTSTVVVTGGSLSSTQVELAIIPDEIEVGTFAVAGYVTGSTITLAGAGTHAQLAPILSKLDAFHADYTYSESSQSLTVHPSELRAASVQVSPWPGFPPDLQSAFTVLATQAKGTSLIHDWMYDGRFGFVSTLQKMGANITICDPHRVLVAGPTRLIRAKTLAPDLRAGAAYVLAALIAEGTSTIENAELIQRGHEHLSERLGQLGATISVC